MDGECDPEAVDEASQTLLLPGPARCHTYLLAGAAGRGHDLCCDGHSGAVSPKVRAGMDDGGREWELRFRP